MSSDFLDPDVLRRVAEERVAKQKLNAHALNDTEVRRLYHELQVHQIELEMQNEELRAARVKIENGLSRYTELFEFAPVGYFDLANDSTIRLANLTGAKILGVNRDQLIGRRFDLLVAPEDRGTFNAFLSLVTSVHISQSIEVTMILLDEFSSSYTARDPIVAQIEAIRSPDGDTCRLVVTDISHTRRLESSLKWTERFLRSAMDSIESPMAILNHRGQINYANVAWRRSSPAGGGAQPNLEEGGNYLEYCRGASCTLGEASGIATAIDEVLKGRANPPAIEHAEDSKSGRWWKLCTIHGFARGNDRFAVVLHHDITLVKAAELRALASNRDLAEARTRAEAADRAKSAFLANMSHEIRTPLTAILGFTDLLLVDSEINSAPETRNEAIETIANAGRHLLSIINDVLDLSKIEADEILVEKIDTHFIDLLHEVEDLLQNRAQENGNTLSLQIAGPVPERIVTDPTRLRQIIVNLASNGLKFCSCGEVVIAANSEVVDNVTHLMIDVEDTGQGMTPEQADRIFKPFCQGDETVNRKHGGTGLGLAISRRLAELMGGSVALVRSLPGIGSCFRLQLPVEVVPGFPAILEMSRKRLGPNPAEGGHGTEVRGRILFAEDGPDNRRLIAYLLRKAGADVDVADNGRIALDMLELAARDGHPYDLLLTDMDMPEMDGYRLTRGLRDRGVSMPIVALTAHALAHDKKTCMDAGCSDYLSKPIDKFALLSTCAKWIGSSSAEIHATANG